MSMPDYSAETCHRVEVSDRVHLFNTVFTPHRKKHAQHPHLHISRAGLATDCKLYYRLNLLTVCGKNEKDTQTTVPNHHFWRHHTGWARVPQSRTGLRRKDPRCSGWTRELQCDSIGLNTDVRVFGLNCWRVALFLFLEIVWPVGACVDACNW